MTTSANVIYAGGRTESLRGKHLRGPAVAVVLAIMLAACGGLPKRSGTIDRLPESSDTSSTRGGGYYLDDGPGPGAPADIGAIPDAVPRIEPLHRGTMRPYVVMGRSYTPMTELTSYKARGIASWYGRRYHGKKTSSGETYDMYAMSAAHTVLPIPSYVRVTNVTSGKSIVVRVNDRGPFIDSRLIDLSYTAAYKLGLISAGSGTVEVESIIPGSQPPTAVAAPAPIPPPPTPAAPVAIPVTPDPTPVTATPLPAPSSPTMASAPVPAPAVTPSSTAVTGAMVGSYVQFGAFGVRENAENYLARLQTQATWLAGSLHVHHSDGIYRVQAGPYASDAAARETAERASQTLGTKPVIITR